MFLPRSFDHGKPDPFEYMPCTASTVYALGMALKLASGALVKASGTDVPEYIAMEDKAAVAGDKLAVLRVSDDTVYETELSVASASIAIGAKYTIDTTGGMITATTTSGVAEVVDFDGKAAGDKVRVRF